MAFTGSAGAGIRIFVLILLIAAVSFGGIIWFDYLGIVNARESLSSVFALFSKEKVVKLEDDNDEMLLDRERFKKMKEALSIQAEELSKKDEDLKKKEVAITQKLEMLTEREKALEEREKSFNTRTRLYENKIANLEQSSKYLVGMPPEKARDILLEMGDQDVIDILRVTERLAEEAGESSLVAYWLSLMPADRSASIQRKMTIKPDETVIR